jgi:hypothetical protein
VVNGTEAQRQAHVLSVLRRFSYATLTRGQKGLVIRYLLATSGYSRQHLTRLIAQFRDHTNAMDLPLLVDIGPCDLIGSCHVCVLHNAFRDAV